MATSTLRGTGVGHCHAGLVREPRGAFVGRRDLVRVRASVEAVERGRAAVEARDGLIARRGLACTTAEREGELPRFHGISIQKVNVNA